MRRGTESFGEGVKGIFLDMADYAISQFERMALNYAMFGNIKGEFSAGSGILGSLGSLFKIGSTTTPVTAASTTSWAEWLTESGLGFYQHGGLFNQPTMGVIGESGPEAVIPLKDGKIPIEGGGGNITNFIYIEATDVNSFERRYGSSITNIIRLNKKVGMM